MNGFIWIHIAGGMVALAAGTVAAAARKGGRVHVAAGGAFAASMLVLGVTASIIAPFASPPQSSVGGVMACYFVATGWLAARRRSDRTGTFEKIACAIVLVLGALIIADGVQRALAPPGQFTGPPAPGALILLGGICLLAGLGDLRYVRRRTQSATQRLSRHLWRMCFAFFIATGSFFLGQQDVLPMAVRGSPILFVAAFAPLALLLFWLVRVRFSGYPPGDAVPNPDSTNATQSRQQVRHETRRLIRPALAHARSTRSPEE